VSDIQGHAQVIDRTSESFRQSQLQGGHEGLQAILRAAEAGLRKV
jgi:hypothetical protein